MTFNRRRLLAAPLFPAPAALAQQAGAAEPYKVGFV
jgi:hypothetical protein